MGSGMRQKFFLERNMAPFFRVLGTVANSLLPCFRLLPIFVHSVIPHRNTSYLMRCYGSVLAFHTRCCLHGASNKGGCLPFIVTLNHILAC